MKIQPIDFNSTEELIGYTEPVKPVPAVKSRFKRLFERQFGSVLRISAAPEKAIGVVEEPAHLCKDGSEEFEPSSVCLAKMVQNFMEENDKQSSAAVRCSRNRCNCFNGNFTDDSDEEFESFNCFGDSVHSSSNDAFEILKSSVLCASVRERNLLADTAKIVEENKIYERKDDGYRKIVTDGLVALGYDASICKSRWEKSPSYPAGEYEYVDVIVGGERLIIDIDFRSEFEIARSTKSYNSMLQMLPLIFVGKADRLQKIISIISEAAKQSLRKKEMHFPPWRKADYVKAKWLSPCTRMTTSTPTLADSSSTVSTDNSAHETDMKTDKKKVAGIGSGGLKLNFGAVSPPMEANNDAEQLVFSLSDGSDGEETPLEKKSPMVVKPWEPPGIKPKVSPIGAKVIAGLASVIGDEGKP